jgi:hypothetical protein
VAIGMPVRATFERFDDDLTLPVFVPADAPATAGADHAEGGK